MVKGARPVPEDTTGSLLSVKPGRLVRTLGFGGKANLETGPGHGVPEKTPGPDHGNKAGRGPGFG